MAKRLHPDEPVDEGVRRVAETLLDRIVEALTEADDSVSLCHLDDPTDRGDFDDAVHRARVDCKRYRGLLRLVRPPLGDDYRRENVAVRDIARQLAPARDAAVVVETFDAAVTDEVFDMDDESLDALRVELVATCDEQMSDAPDLSAIIEDVHVLRDRLTDWPLDDDGFDLLAGGLKKTYRSGRRGRDEALESASPTAFHEWRKDVKYHLYHVGFLRPAWPKSMKAREHELKRLARLLGTHHDYTVLEATLVDVVETSETTAVVDESGGITAALTAERTRLAAAMHQPAARLYAESPKRFTKRIGQYWDGYED